MTDILKAIGDNIRSVAESMKQGYDSWGNSKVIRTLRELQEIAEKENETMREVVGTLAIATEFVEDERVKRICENVLNKIKYERGNK